jgi:hypothetical protein
MSRFPTPTTRLHHAARGLALILILVLVSCQSTSRFTGLSVSSDPPGAHVYINGQDTGFVTPCLLDTADADATELRLDLEGYAPARRSLTRVGRTRIIFWNEMLASWNTWHFPLFLNYEDFFAPVKHSEVPWPARIFVRLERAADR